jgi:hypothetical protein
MVGSLCREATSRFKHDPRSAKCRSIYKAQVWLMGMLGVDAIFSAMSSSSMEVACAWRLHGKKSASRSQSIESRHFARGAREQKEACNNEMSLSNRRKKLMGFLRMDLSP